MKKQDFHRSFIMELSFVALVTIVSMISVRFLLFQYLPTIMNTPQIEYTNSQIMKD